MYSPPSGTDSDQRPDTPGGRMGTDFTVIFRPRGTELGHLAEHSHRPRSLAFRGEVRQVVESGSHRYRVRVVAIVDDDSPAGQLDLLTAKLGEPHLPCPLDERLRPALRAACPAPIAASAFTTLWACRKLNSNVACSAPMAISARSPRCPFSSTGTVRQDTDVGGSLRHSLRPRRATRLAFGPGAERQRPHLSAQVRPQRLGQRRHHADAVSGQRGDQLGLRLGDVLDRAEQLEVDRADVRDDADLRTARSRRARAICPGPRIAISSTRARVPSVAPSTASGSPTSVL